MATATDEFDVFAESCAATLFKLAYLLTGHRQAAEDLTQDALLKIFRHWGRVQAADHPVAYAKRVLTNCHLSETRRRRVSEVPGLELRDVEITTAVDLTASVDARDEMWEALAELSDRRRTVLVLRYYEGMSDGDIARVLRWRPASVRSTAARALAQLRTSADVSPSRPTQTGGDVSRERSTYSLRRNHDHDGG